MKLTPGQDTGIHCGNCKDEGRGISTMIIRENSENASLFLGCRNYPTCRHTMPIPEEYKMRAAGQKGLFDE